MPFYALRDTEVSYKVIQGERPTKPPNANEIGISDGLWQLLTRCWDADYTKRPLIGEIFEQLCQEPARGRIFPPSRHPQIPSYESILDSGTQKYGNGSEFKLARSHAYSSTADIFVTAAAQTPIEGMVCATLRIGDINTSVIRMRTVPHAHEPYRCH